MFSNYSSIVVLTGAGISAESGIRTFRAADGLWEEHRIEDVATPEAYEVNPALVHGFYNARREHLLNDSIQPNAAHQALADFERDFFKRNSSGQFTLVTQNIDDLHERAGSSCIHMHGELLKARCKKTNQLFSCLDEVDESSTCPCCNTQGNLRPHVVWFGEMPLQMDEIYDALADCDLFIAIGTSGNVYPAAGFVQAARQAGAKTVELNLEPSAVTSSFDEQYYGMATEVVPEFFTAGIGK